MMYSQRQPLKVRQNNMTLLFLSISGTPAIPVVSGLDAKFVKNVVDLGAGNYQIVFKDIARRNLIAVGQSVFTDGIYLRVVAVAKDSVTVICKTFGGIATDADFNITLGYHEDPTLY